MSEAPASDRRARTPRQEVLGSTLSALMALQFAAVVMFGKEVAAGDLPFPMLADTKRELSTALGILHRGEGVPLRATFIVDPEGYILTDAQLREVLDLAGHADSVELKLTVPDSERRSTVDALGMDPLEAQIRQVFFFDTPDLALNKAGVVARARRIQGKGGDSVVKLRPVVPDRLPDSLRKSPNLVIEVDAMPGGNYVCSAALKAPGGIDDAREVAQGTRPIRKLFSKQQRAFFAEHAPEGVGLDDLSVLGPITLLKLKFSVPEYTRPLVAELWFYPDGSRILELSTKCPPSEAFQVAAESRGFLSGRGVDLTGEQQTKTKTALQYLSRELAGA